MTIAWVIGGGGLLGSALCRTLHQTKTNLVTPVDHFCWDNEPALIAQLEVAVKTFAAIIDVKKKWQIYWAAGVGTMSSTEAELAIETRILSTLFQLIESEPRLTASEGCFVFASSAGAIYAGTTGDIITENTPAAPTTAYAHEKLRQENIIRAFALLNCRVTVLLARISTLYGPGQSTGKLQGLIALIARRILRNQPVQIYVPLDTIRDYIAADDAAAAIVTTLFAIGWTPGIFTKIIASEQPATIAEIISIYRKVARRAPRIVASTNNLSYIYTRRMQFHSIVFPAKERVSKTSLLVGIAQVMAAERFAFSLSRING